MFQLQKFFGKKTLNKTKSVFPHTKLLQNLQIIYFRFYLTDSLFRIFSRGNFQRQLSVLEESFDGLTISQGKSFSFH